MPARNGTSPRGALRRRRGCARRAWVQWVRQAFRSLSGSSTCVVLKILPGWAKVSTTFTQPSEEGVRQGVLLELRAEARRGLHPLALQAEALQEAEALRSQ